MPQVKIKKSRKAPVRANRPGTLGLDRVVGKSTVRPATKRRDRRTELKKNAILDASLALFSRQGLHGTSLDQIATAADVSKTNLFYYFASKDEIYAAVHRRLLDAWLEPLRQIDLNDDPEAAISSYIRRKIQFSREQPDASRLFCFEILQGAPLIGEYLRTSLRGLVREKAHIIQRWVEEKKLRPIDPYQLIFAIWATTQHYADFAVQIEAVTGATLADKTFFEASIENLQAFFLSGILVGERTG